MASKSARSSAMVAVQRHQSVLVRRVRESSGKSVALEPGLVIGDFLSCDLRREHIKAQQLVPDQIIFLAPGIRLVEGDPVVVADRRRLASSAGRIPSPGS